MRILWFDWEFAVSEDNEEVDPHLLINSTHEFPCSYLFKVIGHDVDNFVGRVVQAVRQELDEAMEPPFHSRKSSNGKHVSVTIEPIVESSHQVIAIYAKLQSLDGLKMLL